MRRSSLTNIAALAAGVLLVLLTTVAQAHATDGGWWQKDWPYRKQITIDTTPKGANIDQPAGRTAVLVRLHSGNFSFSDSQENGNDLRFVASDDKTPLAFHIESFDPVLGVATVWVDVPDFPAGATKDIWLYYGNRNAPAAANSAATFDPDFALVYHFDGVAGMSPRDKTAYGNNAQAAPSGLDSGGVIAKAARFAGKAPIAIGPSASLEMSAGAQFTFSAWVKFSAPQSRAILFSRRDGDASLLIGLDRGIPFLEASGAPHLVGARALARDQWTHVAAVADGAKLMLYMNGQIAATADGALPAMKTGLALAGDSDAASGNAAFAGEMDEVRLSRAARSAISLYADVVGQGPEARLVRFGTDEKQSGVGFGYFGIIVQNVTLDAWVVIAILGLMALSSWIVMWTKASYVGALDRANNAFLEIYRRAGGEITAVNAAIGGGRGGRRLGQSSIYRIYRAGADEVTRRADGMSGRLVLHAEAIEVLRALMDATLIRENQKLARNMVLLTISISGGPFLGLLGTVVGVMITFAAIAASGDVNINAIAPGISAALLATVAGLAVAIPALFGYNYLIIRNKNVTADMQVFVDEFVTRVSELYRERSYVRAAE